MAIDVKKLPHAAKTGEIQRRLNALAKERGFVKARVDTRPHYRGAECWHASVRANVEGEGLVDVEFDFFKVPHGVGNTSAKVMSVAKGRDVYTPDLIPFVRDVSATVSEAYVGNSG